MYVSGFGGTGKSYLIKALVGFMYVQTYILGQPCDSILGAPTGLAADNIKGQTLHSIFNIPVEHGSHPRYHCLNKIVVDQMRAVMKNLQCVIIDEVSMVSNIMLLLIHLRMGEIFDINGLFGNKSVILFGDLLQLPPVHSDPPFIEINPNLMHKVTGGSKVALNLWRNFTFDELTINQRQVGDKNAAWKDMLYRIRIGTHTADDIKILSDRCISISLNAQSPDDILSDIQTYYLNLASPPVCFTPTCKMSNRFNHGILKKEHPTYENAVAKDEIDCKSKSQIKNAKQAVEKLDKLDDPRNTAGLEKTIPLAVGVEIMLRQNLDVTKGLFNGAIGEVIGLQRKTDSTIAKLQIQFEKAIQPVELTRVKRKIKLFEGAYLHREQFPICICYAMTIHKSQCLTLDSAMMDLGRTIFAESQAYVALSRVTSLEGLHMINFNPRKIIVNKAALVEYARLGSKCVPSQGKQGEKLSTKDIKTVPERVWYISSTRKKAQAHVEATLNDTIEAKGKTRLKRKAEGKPSKKRPAKSEDKSNDASSGKMPKTAKKPSGNNHTENPKSYQGTNKVINVDDSKVIEAVPDQFRPIWHDPQESISRIIDLLFQCPKHDRITHHYPIMDSHRMLGIYNNILHGYGMQQSDMMRHRLAIELHPDPFNEGTSQQKWLSSEIMDHYGWLLHDKALHGRSNVYYLSSIARYIFMQARSSVTSRCIRDYIENAHQPVHYSVHVDSDELEDNHTPEKGLEVAGDPLNKDMIFTFGNDAAFGHWYCIVLDKREHVQPPTVTLYDSGYFSPGDVRERCSFFVKFLNALNRYGRSVYSFQWSHNQFDEHDFSFIGGRSVRQQNGFDCGIYALLNGECALLTRT